jgi:hypothetical protein
MYDIIGNVTDEQNRPIIGVVVDDGFKGTSTDGLGYYELKTEKNKINFRMIGYKQESFDLSKYKDGSKVNVDITLKPDTESTTYKAVEVIAKRNPQVVQEKGLTKKQMKVIGFSLLGVALILTSVLIYKAVKKQ